MPLTMWFLSRRMNIAGAVAIWMVIIYMMLTPELFDRIDRIVIDRVRYGQFKMERGDLDDRIFPWKELLIVGLYLPVNLAIYGFCRGMRRRYRVSHQLCAECGHEIEGFHGHCPGCGVRIGPDRANMVYVLRG